MEKNRANIRSLNDMNKTPLYYASKARKSKFGWQLEVGNVLDYKQLTQGDNKSRKDHLMQKEQAKVTHDEIMFAIYEARRRKSKQPSSLTLEQENQARARFYANQIKGPPKSI